MSGIIRDILKKNVKPASCAAWVTSCVIVTCAMLSGCAGKAGMPEKNMIPAAPDTREDVEQVEKHEQVRAHNILNGDYEGIDAAAYGWGLKKNEGAEPDVGKYAQITEKYNACYMDHNGCGKLYLTFDEGYENGYSDAILDVLREKNVKAVFFITGPYLKTQERLVRRMADEGHEVGNHTVDHPNIAKLTPEEIAQQVGDLNDRFYSIFGKNMRFMRPPEGAFSERSLAVIRDLGYKTVFWSFAYRDWERDKVMGADYAFSQITPYLHDGAILLLHAVSADNAAALGRVIDYARTKGFEFAQPDELWSIDNNI